MIKMVEFLFEGKAVSVLTTFELKSSAPLDPILITFNPYFIFFLAMIHPCKCPNYKNPGTLQKHGSTSGAAWTRCSAFGLSMLHTFFSASVFNLIET